MGLSDRTVKYQIKPIIALPIIDKILIVRDTLGPDIEKVEYYSPPSWALKISFIKTIYKLILLLFLSFKEKPKLIHSYLLYPHGYLAFIIGKLTGCKIGVSLIAGPVEIFTFGKIPIGKYVYGKDLPTRTKKSKIIYKILNSFDIIIVAGSYTKKILTKELIKKNKISIIPYIITDENCSPRNTNKIYDIIYVGRLAKVKHIENIILIIKSLVKTYNMKNIKAAIIGDGPEKENLVSLVEDYNLSKNIKFLGYKRNIGKFFNMSKLSIVTSERETGPFTVLESLKCGVPVVASNCSDTIMEILTNGYNGYVIEDYEDIHGYSKKIYAALNNEQTINRLSKNSIKSVTFLSKKYVSKKWLRVFEKISVFR